MSELQQVTPNGDGEGAVTELQDCFPSLKDQIVIASLGME